jgi:heme oxygenase (biliverdin-IX-beta and delta-forming)
MISTEIKEATKAAHLDLEKKVVQRLKDIRTHADYAALLRYFYAYFHHVEQAIAPYMTDVVLPDYKSRRNSSYLKRDIEALGGNVLDLPKTTVPVIADHLEALGALYVMEGSIMGGSIIVKMLEKAGIHDGVSFFSGYGESTPQMWGLFVSVLNRQSVTDEQKARTIHTANETFTHFGFVFDRDAASVKSATA